MLPSPNSAHLFITGGSTESSNPVARVGCIEVLLVPGYHPNRQTLLVSGYHLHLLDSKAEVFTDVEGWMIFRTFPSPGVKMD